MKISITFTCDDTLRKAVYMYYNGGDGTRKASREDMFLWFIHNGESVNEDALSEYQQRMDELK